MPASLVKAYITILPPAAATVGAAAALVGAGETIPVHYNPTEYTMSQSSSFPSSPVPSSPDAPPTQFRGAEPRQISIEIFLDGSGDPPRNVEADVQKLFNCLTPHPTTLQGAPAPPIVLFGWGASPMPQFKAVITSLRAQFTRFDPSGKATRANVVASLKQVPDPAMTAATNPTSGSVDARSTHVVVAGETLASIAYREYRNPGLWRALAEVNRIDDPMRIPNGTRLLVPSVEEAEQYA